MPRELWGYMGGLALPHVLGFLLLFLRTAAAETVVVPPGSIQTVLATARPADELQLAAGIHDGPLVLDQAVTLTGTPGAVVQGDGTGSVIRVTVPGVVVRGLAITSSGTRSEALDAGIFLDQGADGAVIEGNTLSATLYGIVVQGAQKVVIRNNRIANRNDIWLNHRGDGMSLWRTTGTVVSGNWVEGGRDGILVHVAHGNRIIGNYFTGLRFAVHYMYANDNEVTDNVSNGNHVGYALMYSRGVRAGHNLSREDEHRGLILHTLYHSEVVENHIQRTHDQCAFVYTSAHNVVRGNRFEGCRIGVYYAGGAPDNIFTGNSFVNTETPVCYVGTTLYEWSQGGRGNYWSSHAAFDLNGDGIADLSYRPYDVIDRIVWTHSLAKLLLSSPAVAVVRFVQKQLPALAPGGVIDSAPLMVSPPVPGPWKRS